MARKKTRIDSDAKKEPPKKRRFRVGCSAICLLLLVVLGVGLFFAPTIVANTSLRNKIVPIALSGLEGQVAVDSVSLGWFSKVELSGVRATGNDGEPLFEIKKVASDKTLWDLIWNQSQLGKFTIEQPHIHVQLSGDSSNLEDAISGLLTSSNAAMPQFEVVVSDGVIDLQDMISGDRWSMEQVAVDVSASGKGSELTVQAAMNVGSDKSSGKLEANVRMESSDADATTPNLIAIKSEALDMSVFQPIARRFVGAAATQGTLACNCTYGWDDQGTHSIHIDDLRASQLSLGAADWLGSDRLNLPFVLAKGDLSTDGEHLSADQLTLTSDLAKVEANGSFRLSELSPDIFTMLLQNQDFRVTGEVDLTQLAAAFPQTLRIREGTRVTSGKISATLYSRVENEQRRWAAVLESANVTATNGGRTIRWDQPVHVAMFANRTANGPVIENISCKSSFLQLQGQGSLAQGQVTASGDLDQLAMELSKFVSLDGIQLAGQLSSKINWSPGTTGSQLKMDAGATVQNFALVVPGALPWREQQLTMSLSAIGRIDEQQIKSIETGSFRVESSGDVLDVNLTDAVARVDGSASLPVRCELRGQLATWLPRVQTWVPLGDWTLAGNVDFQASGTASSQAFDFSSSKLTVRQFRAQGRGLRIVEPEVRADVALAGDLTTGAMTSKQATLVSSTISLRTGNVKVEPRAGGVALSGQVAFRGDLDRLMSWTHDGSSQPQTHLFGQATGQASLMYQEGVTLAEWSADIENFVYAQRQDAPATNVVATANASPWKAVWQEKRLSFKGKGDLAHVSGGLNAEYVDVVSSALRLSAKGKVNDWTKRCVVDASGELTYDLKTVAPLLRPYLGQGFAATGSEIRKFTIRGPLFHADTSSANANKTKWLPDQLVAESSLGWSTAHLQGFDFGKGDLQAKLSEGVVRVEPIDLPVNQGRIKLAPQVLLNSDPAVLVAERGRVIDRVQISPEMCHAWLKYVAPLLADATVAKGEFSMDLESAKIPLMSPTTGSVRGTLDVHGAQVGPGPLGQQIEAIARQVISLTKGRGFDPSQLGSSREWLTLPEQKIKYQLSDGRVYHDGLQIISREVTIVTKGYVGLDQSLSLTAQIPIRDEWVAGNKLLASLKGQTLEIPIRGTLSRPSVDNQIFTNLGKSMLGGSVENLIEDQLKKGLQGLFGPRD